MTADVSELKMKRWDNCYELFRWAEGSCSIIKSRRKQNRESEVHEKGRETHASVDFNDGERGHEPKNTSVQLSSVPQLCPTLWPHGLQACRTSLSITNSRSLLKLMFLESVMPSNHLILCCLLLLLPSIFPSTKVFSNESVLHIRWPKHWSFSFRVSPSNEYSGLISFRIDWLDLLAVQGTLKSFP